MPACTTYSDRSNTRNAVFGSAKASVKNCIFTSSSDDEVKMQFFTEAFADPKTALRVLLRSEYVVQAGIGTNQRLRNAVLALAKKTLDDPSSELGMRFCAAAITFQLGLTNGICPNKVPIDPMWSVLGPRPEREFAAFSQTITQTKGFSKLLGSTN